MQMTGCSFELHADYNSNPPTPFWQNSISHTPVSTHFPKEKNGHAPKKAIANGSQTSKHVVYKFWKIRSTCEFREQKGTKTWLASRNSHATVLGLLASNNMAKKKRMTSSEGSFFKFLLDQDGWDSTPSYPNKWTREQLMSRHYRVKDKRWAVAGKLATETELVDGGYTTGRSARLAVMR